MDEFEEKLAEYAQLLVSKGLALQKGQTLTIVSPIACAPLARLCAKKAYEMGVREVVVDWRDDQLSRMKYLHAQEEVFDQAPPWMKPMYDHYTDIGAARLVILGEDPLALTGVDSGRISRWQQASFPAIQRYSEAQMAGQFQWCVASFAVAPWAKQVFGDMPEESAVKALWEKIFAAVRVTGRGEAVAAWDAHLQRQKALVDTLNGHQFTTLCYKNSLGTNLTVGLPAGHIWQGGSEPCKSIPGLDFIPNMPSEEIFTLPHRQQVNGRVYGAMPLVLSGNLVEGFWLELKEGKIVDLHADVGEDYLREAIAVDEGAAYLGEVALVPYHSPIRDTGILFYQTLFDENAACHFAFGKAYPCLKDADGKTNQELLALGVNNSLTHVDFMVGTHDLNIIGTTPDGRELAVFIGGDFAL